MAGIKYNAAKMRSLGIYVEFDKDTADGTILQVLKAGQTIINVDVDIATAFDAGYSFTVGTPADNDKFVKTTDINVTKERNTEINHYFTATVDTTIAFYKTGVSTGGAGTIFIELL
jgi:hypothetical protein